MDWKKLALVFSGSFVVSGLAVGAALAPLLNANPITVGFWANIGGGIVGGAMTLGAGWLAWTAAQKQIAAQMAVLALATDEHGKRTVRTLHEISMVAKQIASASGGGLGNALRIDFFTEAPPIAGIDWQTALDNPDFWRIDFSLADDIRSAQTALLTYNRGDEQIARLLGRPPRTTLDRARIQSEALDILRRCRAEARRLELMSHSAARPAEPPAQ